MDVELLVEKQKGEIKILNNRLEQLENENANLILTKHTKHNKINEPLLPKHKNESEKCELCCIS